jgi:hypothetical protein
MEVLIWAMARDLDNLESQNLEVIEAILVRKSRNSFSLISSSPSITSICSSVATGLSGDGDREC